jgi:hypothetical protein
MCKCDENVKKGEKCFHLPKNEKMKVGIENIRMMK